MGAEIYPRRPPRCPDTGNAAHTPLRLYRHGISAGLAAVAHRTGRPIPSFHSTPPFSHLVINNLAAAPISTTRSTMSTISANLFTSSHAGDMPLLRHRFSADKHRWQSHAFFWLRPSGPHAPPSRLHPWGKYPDVILHRLLLSAQLPTQSA